MASALKRLKSWFSRTSRTAGPQDLTPPSELLSRYRQYKRLLAANTAILNILADLQLKRDEGYLFDMAYVRGAVNRLGQEVTTLVDALIQLSGGRYKALETSRARIAAAILEIGRAHV